MTKDRIKDLPKTISWPHVSYKRLSRQRRSVDGQNVVGDGPLPLSTVQTNNEHHVAEFLAQIDLLSMLIHKIDELAKNVEEIHRKMIEPMADPKLGQELDNKTADIKNLAYDVSTKLKKMEQIQQDQARINQDSAQWRIKEAQIFNITKDFREVMNRYNQEYVLHRERCKRAIVRELEITGNRRTDDEVEEMLESGFPGTFSFSIMVDVEKARRAANLIEERHRDITKLEESIRELHAMFVDLAFLVASQGEMIDNIEHNVFKTVDFVESATENVEQAYKNKKAATKKKLIVVGIVLVVVLVLIFVCVSYYLFQRKIFGR